MSRIENEVEDAQTVVHFLLQKFGITLNRIYGQYSISAMLETLLDPLGMMYDYEESVTSYSSGKTEYVLAFRETGSLPR